MFEFIKKIFTKEEPVVIDRKDLKGFVQKKYDNSSSLEMIDNFKKAVDEKSKELKNTIDILMNAKLHNENIPEKHKVILSGNRTAYQNKTNVLLNELEKIKINENQIYENIKDLKFHIDNFSFTTQKQYAIMQEFFSNESYNVARRIKSISDLIEKLENDISKSDYFNYKQILDLFSERRNREKHSEELKKEINSVKHDLKKFEEEINEIEKSKKELMGSKEYSKFIHLGDEIKLMKSKKDDIEYNIKDNIGHLGRALRKYSKISFDERLIESIIDQPISLLDNVKTTYEVFSGLKSQIENDKISLKGNVKEKNLKILNMMNKAWLENIKNEVEEINSKIKETKKDLKTMDITSKIEELDAKTSRANYDIESSEKKLGVVTKELERVTFSDIDEKIEKLLEKLNVVVS